MPLYSRIVQVDAQTPAEDAVEVMTEVREEVVTEAEVFIDPGSNGEVRVVLLDGETRVLPASEGDPIAKPGTSGPVPLDHRLPGVPSEVTVKVWAPDADFPHEVIVSWETRPPEQVGQLDRLLSLFSPTDVSGQD
jgi:hypothetical protein